MLTAQCWPGSCLPSTHRTDPCLRRPRTCPRRIAAATDCRQRKSCREDRQGIRVGHRALTRSRTCRGRSWQAAPWWRRWGRSCQKNSSCMPWRQSRSESSPKRRASTGRAGARCQTTRPRRELQTSKRAGSRCRQGRSDTHRCCQGWYCLHVSRLGTAAAHLRLLCSSSQVYSSCMPSSLFRLGRSLPHTIGTFPALTTDCTCLEHRAWRWRYPQSSGSRSGR
jgi:hypothetical protein